MKLDIQELRKIPDRLKLGQTSVIRIEFNRMIDTVDELQKRLDAIDSAEPSNAIEALKELLKYSWSSESISEADRNVFLLFHKIIRHALLKAASTETELENRNAQILEYETSGIMRDYTATKAELTELKKKSARYAILVRLARTPHYTITHDESQEMDILEKMFLCEVKK